MTERKHFLEANETILSISSFVNCVGQDRSVIQETPHIGLPMSIADVLDELSDDTIHTVRRINVETWESKDVTEQVARAYLNAEDEKPSGVRISDEREFPLYVKNSRAWSLWKDDLEAERPVQPDPDRAYDERRDRLAMGWV